jgi:hypothetical protein
VVLQHSIHHGEYVMSTFRDTFLPTFAIFLVLGITACTQHQVEVKPVEIKPIHITIDINVKIDKELDDFFGDIDETQAEEPIK